MKVVGKEKEKIVPIKMKYKQIMSFEFSSTMQKISVKETSNKNACAILRIVREVQKGRDQAMKDYQVKVAEVYGVKDENGKLKRPPGEAQGAFEPIKGKEEEIVKAQDELNETEFEVHSKPLNFTILSDMKLSAQDFNVLGPLFVEEETPTGPPLPPNFEQHLAST